MRVSLLIAPLVAPIVSEVAGSLVAPAIGTLPNGRVSDAVRDKIGMNTQSTYMRWAKTRPKVKYDLALSGILNLPFPELEAKIEDIDLNGDNSYGYGPLNDAVAEHCNVPRESVVTISGGTSMANHLAMAAAIEHGDEILIEQPTYEPLLALAQYFNASIKRFSRPFENDFLVDLDELAARQSEWFDEEIEKLDKWSEDKRAGLKADLKELDDQIKALKREIRQTGNLPDKLALQRQAADEEVLAVIASEEGERQDGHAESMPGVLLGRLPAAGLEAEAESR